MADLIHLEGVFRQIVDAAPNAMVLADLAGRVEMVNVRAEAMFGYNRNEIRGQPIGMLVPERFRGELPELWAPLVGGAHLHCPASRGVLFAVHENGSEFPVEIGFNPIETGEGTMILAAIIDISRRKEEEERIRAALKEKEILLGEIHHRVKNNLQIISSLLTLQAAHILDPAAQDLLRDSQNRIQSMALIHETLYGSNDFAQVDFAIFVDKLLAALIGSYNTDTSRIAIRVDVEPVCLPIDIAVPCGLVVNELITNAFRHAFRGRERGEIRVSLTRQPGGDALLSVSDDGIGLSDQADTAPDDTLGLQLVELLAGQMEGTLSINRSNPTRFSLLFPI